MNYINLLSRHFLMVFKNRCRHIVFSRNVIINRELPYYKRLLGTSINQSSGEFDEFEYEDIFAQPEQIAGDNSEKLHLVKKIVCEIDLMIQSGKLIYFPRKLTNENWQHLLTLDSEQSRQKYYKYLCVKEKLKECKNIKKEQNKYPSRSTHSEAVPSTSSFTTNNSLNWKGYFIFLPKFKNIATRLHLHKVARAMMFGPHLIIDCSGDYESHMTNQEIKMCARQIISARYKNQNSFAPFNILHCNLNPEGRLMNELKRLLPNLDKPEKFFNFTEKSHAELFPVNQLVYLSPHSDNELDSYDPCCTYIVGAIVDLIINDPISMLRAQSNGLRTAKLPIDGRVNWCKGTKLLALNRVIEILRDKRNGASWEYAFRNITARKLTYNFTDRKHTKFNTSDPLSEKYIRTMYWRDICHSQNTRGE